MEKGHMAPSKRVLQYLLKKYLEWSFDIEVKNNVTLGLRPPYLLIGNHQNNWDGFLMSIYVNEPISFVISDEQYRNPIVAKLLHYIDAIPTIKARPDVSTIKRMIRVKNEGRIIGLFPEGNRTWDGLTEPIYYSTAKLLKLLNIPVVLTKFQGGHLASPRWARSSRRGKIIMSYDLFMSVEDIKKMSVDEIYQKLTEGLYHDEFHFQQEHMFRYKGKKLAEKLENFLFTCPSCHTIDRLESKDEHFFCKQCGYAVEYTEYGLFKPSNYTSFARSMKQGDNQENYFHSPRDWNKWQLKFLESILQSPTKGAFRDENIILKQGERNKSMRVISTGSLSLDFNYLYYSDREGEIAIPLKQVDGLNLQVKNQLDLYYKDTLYRFSFVKSKASPYKWLKAIQFVQEQAKESKQVPHS